MLNVSITGQCLSTLRACHAASAQQVTDEPFVNGSAKQRMGNRVSEEDQSVGDISDLYPLISVLIRFLSLQPVNLQRQSGPSGSSFGSSNP